MKSLKAQINFNNLPKHIAIIMDGNGRWAQKRHLPRLSGHRAGIKAVRRIVKCCTKLGIKILTLYTFSTENWQRPKNEVEGLIRFLYQYLHREGNNLLKGRIKLNVIGDISALPEKVQKEIIRVTKLTIDNDKLILNLAINYGAREEIITAVRKIISSNKKNVDEHTFSNYLYTAGLPDPDLLIRTSGELRVSNFLLWQIAYTEFYFTPVLWPDFTEEELYKAIISYQQRERRFGA